MERLEQELVRRVALLQPELAPRLARRITRTTPAARLYEMLDSDAALSAAVDQALLQEMSDENITMTGADVMRSLDAVRPAGPTSHAWQPSRLTRRRAVPEEAVEVVSPPMARKGSSAKGKGYSAKGPRPSMPSADAGVRAMSERHVLQRPMLEQPALERPRVERARFERQELETPEWHTPVLRGKGRAGTEWQERQQQAPEWLVSRPRGKGRGGVEWQELEQQLPERPAPRPRGKGRGVATICSSRPPRNIAPQEEAASVVPGVSELLQLASAVHPEMASRIVERIAAFGPDAVQDCLGSDAALQQYMNEALVILFNSEADDTMAGEMRRLREACNAGSIVPPVREAPQVQGQAPAPRQRLRPEVVAPRRVSQQMELQPEQAPTSRQRSQLEVAAPAGVSPQNESEPEVSSTGAEGHGKPRIWGLEEFLAELNLSEYLEPATSWAQTMGAAFLEELIENQEDLGADLEMRPLERKRLQRQGPEVAARLVQSRQQEGCGQAAPASSYADEAGSNDLPPEPVRVPLPGGFWRG